MAVAESRAEVVWNGDLLTGNGEVRFASNAVGTVPVSWAARTQRPSAQTSPEELIAAAHAVCYAMALSNTLAQDGHPPRRLNVTAVCSFEYGGGGARITAMDLTVHGHVPGLDQAGFEEAARKGEQGCPVSNALSMPCSSQPRARDATY
jgi:osmotically inducible protein OsmC